MDTTKPIIISIYVLIDPRDEEIRYVGKTENPVGRMKDHLKDKEPCYRTMWIRKLRRMGMIPRMQIIQEVPESFGSEAEIYWIAYFRAIGCQLTNGTDGGDGSTGFRHSEETKTRLRAIASSPEGRLARSKINKNKPLSPERCQILWNGRNRWFQEQRAKGMPIISPETRIKMANSRRGKPASEAQKAKQSAVMKGRKVTSDTRAKISAATKGKPKSPETIQRMKDAWVKRRQKVSSCQPSI